MLEGNTPEFSTSVQDSINVLLMMLSLLFSVQVQISDNRNADVGVGTDAGFVSRCLHSLHIEPQAAAREEHCTSSRINSHLTEDEFKIRNVN